MTEEKKICCICGKEFEGWGNNPYGLLNAKLEPIDFKAEDRCCNECNKSVILGRLILLQKNKKK